MSSSSSSTPGAPSSSASGGLGEGARDLAEVFGQAMGEVKRVLFFKLADVMEHYTNAQRNTAMSRLVGVFEEPPVGEDEAGDIMAREVMLARRRRCHEDDPPSEQSKMLCSVQDEALKPVAAELVRRTRFLMRYLHPDHAKSSAARELWEDLHESGTDGTPLGLLRSMSLLSLSPHSLPHLFVELQSFLTSTFGVTSASRRRRTPSNEEEREVFERAERERADAERDLARRRREQREKLEREAREAPPGSERRHKAQLLLLDAMHDEYRYGRDEALLTQSDGDLPSDDDDCYSEDGGHGSVVLGKRQRRPGSVLIDDDDSEDEGPAEDRAGTATRGRAPQALVRRDDDTLGYDVIQRVGMRDMLVLAFHWFGMPGGRESPRGSRGRSDIYLRHVVFVILELYVSTKEQALAIGQHEIDSNDFLNFKNYKSRVASPWNGFKRFLVYLQSHEAEERQILLTGAMSSGKFTMHNMKRRPVRPRKRRPDGKGPYKWATQGPKTTSSDAPDPASSAAKAPTHKRKRKRAAGADAEADAEAEPPAKTTKIKTEKQSCPSVTPAGSTIKVIYRTVEVIDLT